MRMSVYDSTFILNPQLEESGFDARIKSAVDVITKNGGKLISENRLGMRRMAYDIQKMSQGYYVSLVFEGTGQTISELERLFRLDEGCMRFLTCNYQDFSRRRDRALSVAIKPQEALIGGEPFVDPLVDDLNIDLTRGTVEPDIDDDEEQM
jgi:small subunit ribosomal protein S6